MLISKEQHWRSPAKKLEEQNTAKLQGCQEKGKAKICLNKPSLCLKRMILGEQKNVFLSEFGLIVLAVLKCLFWHNFCRRSLPPAEKLSIFTHVFSNQRFFFMYIM